MVYDLENHKKLYRSLNEARKKCKRAAFAYTENANLLKEVLAERERVADTILSEKRKGSIFGRKKRADLETVRRLEERMAECDEIIGKITRENYENFRQAAENLAFVKNTTKSLMEKHKFLEDISARYARQNVEKWLREEPVRIHFPEYSEIMRRCESVLLFLREYIMKRTSRVS